MIITFLRSSSYTAYDGCPHRMCLEYTLGVPTPSGKKADMGNVVHKAMELLGQQSKCHRLGLTQYEDDTFGLVQTDQINPTWALDQAYEYYVEHSPHHTWFPKDKRDCFAWIMTALNFNNGNFDPRNRHVLDVEHRFDFTFEEDWAHYHYELLDGSVIDGQLALKGVVDLVVQDSENPKIIEIIDWKTGQRRDWSKDDDIKKTYTDFRTDPQLLLYHYAASRVYPDADTIIMTIYWINDGGPFSMAYDREDIIHTKELIQKRFEQIRDDQRPKLNIGKQCYTFCPYGKRSVSPHDPTKTICKFFEQKIRRDGMDQVTHEFGAKNHFMKYGSGGGQIG